jgi:hypothetical protein
MNPALALTTGVAVPTATGGVAAMAAVVSVVVGVAARVVAGSADIRHHNCLNPH